MSDSLPRLRLKPLHDDFIPPKYKTVGSGAFDLHMPDSGVIPDGGSVQVGLGFAMAIPAGYSALVLPRSGVGSKFTVELSNTCGFIDHDYRGEWLATMRTKTGEGFSWKAGERLLQVAIFPTPRFEMDIVDELDATERGEGGYGSTGAL